MWFSCHTCTSVLVEHGERFIHNQLCGLLSKCQLTACQPRSLKRERLGTIALWPQARACWVRVKRERKRVGFDWWVVWKWVSWCVSSTVVNVSPFTRPSSLRDSHMCITAGVFLRARSVWWCWHVLPNVGTVWVIVVLWWVWHAQFMQPMRPSEVSVIITSLWCLVFVVWFP